MSENSDTPPPPAPIPASKKAQSPTQKVVTFVVTFIVLIWLFNKLFPSAPSASDSSPNSSTTATTQQSPSDTTPTTPTDTRTVVSFVGQGGLNDNTAPQRLSGNYTVTWRTNGSCYYAADLNGNDVFSADSQTSGTNYIYDLSPDIYHMHVVTGPAGECTWSARFTPVK